MSTSNSSGGIRTGTRRLKSIPVCAYAAAQLSVLFFQAGEFQNVLDGEQELIGRERLLQEIDRAQPRGAHRHLDAGLARDHHGWSREAERFQIFEKGDPILAGHHHIRKHHVEGLRLHQIERARRVVAHRSLVPGQTESPRQRC